MKYITRMDYDSCRGWWVRLQTDGVSKLFSDSRYGGTLKAKLAAIAYRDAEVQRVGRLLRKKISLRDKRNKTGVVGISYRRYKRWSRHLDYLNGPYWIEEFVVKFTDRHGEHRNRSFSIKKHGRDRAFRLAKAARRSGIAS